MLGRIWQRLLKWFQRLFGFNNQTGKKTKRDKQGAMTVKPLQPLEEADYEYLFMQLLEGVAHGWQQDRILKFFHALGERGNPDLWIGWLRRFAQRLMASSAPNNDLAARMVQMGQLHAGEIGIVSEEIGIQLLTRQEYGDEESQIIEYFSPMYAGYETTPDINPESSDVKTVNLNELMVMMQEDPNFVQQLAEQLQIQTTDPNVIIETLVNQFSPVESSSTEPS